jgi:5-methylcytosine-specific restriction endonuclease McrA
MILKNNKSGNIFIRTYLNSQTNVKSAKEDNMNIRQKIVEDLVATGKWSRGTAELGERANYRCEYCDRDFLESAESYKLWQVDHIVPISAGGDPVDQNNMAIACKQCNWDFKSRWDPREDVGSNATREQLISAVRNHISKQKLKTLQEVMTVREIVGYKKA